MDSNNEYCQRRCFEDVKWQSAKDLLPNPKLYKVTGSAKSEVLWFEATRTKRITVTEPNTEGYLKECLSQYEQENLKTK